MNIRFKFFLTTLLLFVIQFSFSQNKEVSGTVTNTDGDPLPGVNITVKNENTGTQTDFDGNYTIEVAKGATLEFSFVGFQDKTKTVNDEETINVVMDEGSQLNEVVLIGYQSKKKEDLTSSISTYDPEKFKNKTITGTIGDELGTLPGVTARTEGKPGSEGKVEIRGTGTFGDSNPLYVVDGIVSGANRDFNSHDIKSIQILKDASAAAIYGSRAGNGVILIDTKEGQKGNMKIDLSSKATAQWLPKYNLTDRDEWIRRNDMAFENAGKSHADHSNANTNWQDEVFKTGWIQDHNLSLSGGSGKTKYFFSGNYQSNSGTTIGTKSDRISLRANTSTSESFGDHVNLKFGENIGFSNYAVDELSTNPIIDVIRILPTIPIHDSDNEDKGGYGYGDGNRDVTFGTNPFAREDFEDIKNSNLRIRGNAFAELKLFDSFKYKFNFGFNLSNDKYQHLRKEGHWTHNQPDDPSFLNKNQNQYRQLVFDNTFEYNKKFNKHDLSAIIGTSYEKMNEKFIEGQKNNVIQTSDGYFTELDAALSDAKTGSNTVYERLFSLFGRLNYNYDEKYLLSFTIRRDQSSKFSLENNVGYFPSGSLGWRISKESFFNIDQIDNLKIRANYGVLGTSNIGPWDWLPLINVFPQVAFGTDQHIETGKTQVQLTNTDLRWEKMHQLDIGFDSESFNNRFLFSVDYFRKETKDVLTPMQILDATGNNGGDPVTNAATLLNSGVEIATTWRDHISDFNYNIDFNFSYLKNEIKKLGNNRDEFTSDLTKSKVGSSIGEWHLVKRDGVFKSEEEVQEHTNSEGEIIQPEAEPGDIRYVDFNDDGKITDSDRQYAGRTMPKYEVGMNIGAEFKNFDFQAQIAGSFGFKSYNGPRSTMDAYNDNSNYRANYDPWTPDHPEATDPRPLYDDSRNVRPDQDRWLENGSYLRIKQISLGYSIPKKIIKPIREVRLYVDLQNLVTFTSYTGLDPAFLNSDIFQRTNDNGAYPNPRGITFGVDISL